MINHLYRRFPQIGVPGYPMLEIPILFVALVLFVRLVLLVVGAEPGTTFWGMRLTYAAGIWSALSTWRYTDRRDRFYRLSLVFFVRFWAVFLAAPLFYYAFWPATYAASLFSAAADSVTLPWAIPVTALTFSALAGVLCVMGGWFLTIRKWPGFGIALVLAGVLGAERVFDWDVVHPRLPTHIPAPEARETLRNNGFFYIREVEPWQRGLPPARITPRPLNDGSIRP